MTLRELIEDTLSSWLPSRYDGDVKRMAEDLEDKILDFLETHYSQPYIGNGGEIVRRIVLPEK